ncbi:hypothetical protein CMO93_00175 [Candidatus Woesearchaeota archaeon]|jgi:uncharacterized protein with PQ loop repeat|nr:hypothetical protein [Candidatus Woesearchaeota archaeon]|tara:strand:- start:3543 stop:3794 length:252 start_codon:yes stop_codon:yes gene_type:complete
MITTIIGFLAMITGVLRLLPQIMLGYKRKSARDVSLWWEIIGFINSSLWCIYGFLVVDYILASGTFMLAIGYALLISQKKMYG